MKPGLANAIHVLQRDLVENHPEDAVQLLERLPPAEVAQLLSEHPVSVTLPVWERLSPDIGMRATEALPEDRAAELLGNMDSSRAAAFLSMRDPEARENYLGRLAQSQADDLRAILSYPADSAGALMDPRVLLLRGDTTVREALARIRALHRRGVRMLFVADAENRLEGQVDIQDIATATATTQLGEIQRPVRAVVNAVAPREEVVGILERYRLTDLPVVDAEERLIGVVRYRNLMAAAEDEATVAMQTMVGVSKDERALSGVSFAVRKRLPCPILIHRPDDGDRHSGLLQLPRHRNPLRWSALGETIVRIIGLLAASVRRRQRSGGTPFLDPTSFGGRTYAGAMAANQGRRFSARASISAAAY